jgi:hypothetical protein
LLQLCAHIDDTVRRTACEVVEALLLESDPAQLAGWRQAACEHAALLWLLPQCFDGGRQALRSAAPRPAHFAEEAGGEEAGGEDCVPSSGRFREGSGKVQAGGEDCVPSSPGDL